MAAPRRLLPNVAPYLGSKMWKAARMLRRFGAREIAATAEASLTHAERTLILWRRAGFLRIDAKPPAKPPVYRLVRDTGAAPPRRVASRNALLDRNTGELWSLADGARLGVEPQAIGRRAR